MGIVWSVLWLFCEGFSTHMSLLDGVVIICIKFHCSYSFCLVLKLLEELCKAYFDKLIHLVCAIYKLCL